MTHHVRRHGKTIGLSLVAALVTSIVVLWSWNTFMTNLLGSPEMAYRHALALCLLALSLGSIICLPAWLIFRNKA